MSKVVLISGSNRLGNTEYILNKINESINSEIILLKNKKIEFCKGCLACHYNDKCIIDDDINDLIDVLVGADLIVFGVPNYFDNVTGLFKNFMDRLHPLYKSGLLKNKKVIFIYVGGGKIDGTLKCLHQAVEGFSKYLGFDIIHEFSIKALNVNDMKSKEDIIDGIIQKIKLSIS